MVAGLYFLNLFVKPMERTHNSFEVGLGEKRSDIIQQMFCRLRAQWGSVVTGKLRNSLAVFTSMWLGIIKVNIASALASCVGSVFRFNPTSSS